MKQLFVIFYTFVTLFATSQSKLDDEWITGAGGQRIKFIGNSITTNNTIFYSTYFNMGNSNICDTNGTLILCSDGYNVYDGNANYIDGGDTLVPKDHYIAKNGFSNYSQTSLFLPMDSNKYYFITPAFSDAQYANCTANNDCFFDLLLYNVIDMKANAGAGKVVKTMIPLMENAVLSKTQMMACRHSNGKDWWLLKQGGDSNIIYKFLFTQDSVYNMGLQKFNAPVWGTWDAKGQSMFSQDGSKYATVAQGDTVHGRIFLADFDRCYGILSNSKILQAPFGQYPLDTTLFDMTFTGLAFSPDGNKLYLMSHYHIFQCDLLDETWYHVAGIDTSFMQFQLYNNAYLGPNDKLYIGNFGGLSRQMSVINNPDVKGAGCNFCPRCLRMDSLVNGYAGTPPCMPNYSLGAQTCWPESVNEVIQQDDLSIYPNPVHTILYIRTKERMKIELFNSVGQLLYSTYKNEIDVSRYSKGMYYIKAGNSTRKVIID